MTHSNITAFGSINGSDSIHITNLNNRLGTSRTPSSKGPTVGYHYRRKVILTSGPKKKPAWSCSVFFKMYSLKPSLRSLQLQYNTVDYLFASFS